MRHPRHRSAERHCSGCVDADTADADDVLAAQVVAVPGRYFSPRSGEQGFQCNSLRMAFSTLPEERLEEGARRFGALLRDVAARRAGSKATPTPPAAVMHAALATPPAS